MTTEITGRLENWFYDGILGVLRGNVYDDIHGRFLDGDWIRTSSIMNGETFPVLKEGEVISTRNSRYLLGKEKDLFEKEVENTKATITTKEYTMSKKVQQYKSNAHTPEELVKFKAMGALAERVLDVINYDFRAMSHEDYNEWKNILKAEYKVVSEEIKASKKGYIVIDGAVIDLGVPKSELQSTRAFLKKVANTFLNAQTFARNERRAARENAARRNELLIQA